MTKHVEAMLELKRRGSIAFDYGNNLRGQVADRRGLKRAFDIPGFVPAFVRPLFCRGSGPFRWAALSGDPEDIRQTDRALAELFPDNERLLRWLDLAARKVHFQGLPARICWLEYGDRAKAGLAFNALVRDGKVKAPIVIGRDHLDTGSVASPNRETEGMRDGSDAIADWPLLNAMLNTACGSELGLASPRRRGGDRLLHPRGHGLRGGRQRGAGPATRARSHRRPGLGCHETRRRRLRAGDRNGA